MIEEAAVDKSELGSFSEITKGVVFHNTLAGEDGEIRATVMTLNGKPLVLGEDNSLPEMEPEDVPAGEITFEPGTITFLVL